MALPNKWLQYTERYKAVFALGLLCLIAANLFKAAVPVVLEHSVDRLMLGITWPLLFRYSAMLLILAVAQGGFIFGQQRFLFGMARSIERDMRNELYAHLQEMSLEFYRQNQTGELMARATNDIGVAVNASTEALMYSINTIVALMIICPVLIRLSWPLTLLAFAPLLLVIIATLVLQKRMLAQVEKIQKAFGKMCVRAQEALWGARTNRSYGRERLEIEAFARVSRQYVRHNLRRVRLSSLLFPLLQFFIGLSFIAVLWYGGNLTAEGHLSIGQFLEFLLYLGYLAWPMHVLSWELTVLQRGIVSMNRVESILSLQPSIKDPSYLLDMDHIEGSIEFRHVNFKYKGANRPTLEDISFRVHTGQKVALVGAIGSGKSTLLNMVPRLLEPCSGDILIDGRRIQQIPLKLLRSSVGYAPQETFLFSDTIAANISFGNRKATHEQIEQAAIDSSMAADISSFPQSYQTQIGERGIRLSGGQKQRISIARAILSQPAILLFDDALSCVDSDTEEKILTRLQEVLRGKTCLLSSHRISTLRGVDRIIVLHEGRIAEEGTHHELLARGGFYTKMYEMQMLEEELAAS